MKQTLCVFRIGKLIYFPGYLNICERAAKVRLGLFVEDIKFQIEKYGSQTLY